MRRRGSCGKARHLDSSRPSWTGSADDLYLSLYTLAYDFRFGTFERAFCLLLGAAMIAPHCVDAYDAGWLHVTYCYTHFGGGVARQAKKAMPSSCSPHSMTKINQLPPLFLTQPPSTYQ